MIHLDIKTGYSFLKAYGNPEQIIARAKEIGSTTIGIADFCSTWGHIPFWKATKKENIKPLFGVQIPICDSLIKDPRHDLITLIAKNQEGLHEQYEALSLATQQFYYRPRLTWNQLNKLTNNIIIINRVTPETNIPVGEHIYIGAAPLPTYTLKLALSHVDRVVVSCSPLYPSPADQEAYKLAVATGSARKINEIDDVAQWMFHKDELQSRFEQLGVDKEIFEKWVLTGENLIEEINVEPKIGKNIKPDIHITVGDWCLNGAIDRGIDLGNKEYRDRLNYELGLIRKKGFEDYFLLIGDLVKWAKERMFVGPSRGSSAGSLVCYLMGIVEIDPIKHGLLFERFIDLNREDLPDIDIDFPDTKRDQIFKYLVDTYGAEKVARIGTISVWKPKSALNDTGRCYNIPNWEIKKLTEVMIDRSGGDARANMAIQDTIEQFDVGKELANQYPKIRMAERIEGHPRHTGKHAAGVLVSDDDVSQYATINRRDGEYTAMITKYDAEDVGLLKIDALGLKTLSVIEDCCESVNIDPKSLYTLPLDKQHVFQIFQDDKVAGIFQFEGYAVRSLMRQMGVEEFNDIVALTALARPGPLHCGSANEFIERRTGKKEWEYQHPLLAPHTKNTYGTIVYQEQVMSITRDLGDMNWQDVSALRKAMSRSLGEEFFNKYRDKFLIGTKKRKIKDDVALQLWNDMCTFGSWAFNLSHAHSYALLSYWCAYLKSKYPLEFAVAHLKRTDSTDHVIRLLRELMKENIRIIPFDINISEKNWTIRDGKIYGGFLAVKGVGPVLSETFIKMRTDDPKNWISKLTPSRRSKLLSPNNTPWHNLNRLHKKYISIYDDPTEHNIGSEVLNIEDIKEVRGNYCFIATLKTRNLRDLNETQSLAKRNGRIIRTHHLFLNLIFEDDTASILCTIDRWKYESIGVPLMEEGADGEDFLIRGNIYHDGNRKIYIKKIRKIS